MQTSLKDLGGSCCFPFKGILGKILRGKFCSCFKASAGTFLKDLFRLLFCLFVFSKALVCETQRERERVISVTKAQRSIFIFI